MAKKYDTDQIGAMLEDFEKSKKTFLILEDGKFTGHIESLTLLDALKHFLLLELDIELVETKPNGEMIH